MANVFLIDNGDLKLSVTAYTDKVFRFTFGERKTKSDVVILEPEDVSCDFKESDGFCEIACKRSIVRIDKKTLDLEFFTPSGLISKISSPALEKYEIYKYSGGENQTRETVDGIKSATTGGEKIFDRISNHAEILFSLDGNELLFGLGSHEEGYPCINGNFVPMYQENMRIAVPHFLSTKGYSCLVDNASLMTFDCREKDFAKLYIDCADCIDFYFIFGDFDTVGREYRKLTGTTPMLPKASLGYIQSRCEYKNQFELSDVVKKYRELSVPLDIIVQDWQYWNDGCWGDKNLDPKRFPDMTACIDEIHSLGAKVMISIWPNVTGDSENRREFLAKDMLLGDGCVYNAFDENARKTYWNQAYNGLFVHGIDAWWCDCTEPYEVGWGGEVREPLDVRMKKTVDEYKRYVDDAYVNAFSLYHSKGIYENQRAVSQKRVMNMTRSGFSGQHRYATAVWSGDISATWDILHRQIHIMQNYVATGEAYWNSDVGGFFNDERNQWFWKGDYQNGTKDDGYKELYLRWLQFAGFCPIMRSHGMYTKKEIWEFGKKGEKYYDAISDTINLRYSLVPYFYSLNALVTLEGKMPIKPLAFAFPNDEKARVTFDEYLYGDKLLVCPVTEPGIEKMTVYLPEGVWYDYHTNEKYLGGKEYEIPVTIARIPVFAKAGAIIPTVRVMNYIDEIPDAEYLVKIFSGADGEFLLYDDDGCGYDYEKGEYSLIKIAYCEDADESKKISAEQFGKEKFAHGLKFEIIT